MKRAVVFWACRNEYYLKAAEFSAQTAKWVMPDVDTVLLTDLDFTSPWLDRVIRAETPAPEMVTFPPLILLPEEYSSGMYVGSEAYFCKPLYDVFELVEGDRVDIALVHTSGKEYVDQGWSSPDVPEAFPHWRSALVAFQHHEKMRLFFIHWEKEFLSGYIRDGLREFGIRYPDQPAMRTALYHSDLAFVTLPPNYCCTLGDVVVRNEVRIIAYHEDSDPEELAAEANRHAPHARLFMKGKSKRL